MAIIFPNSEKFFPFSEKCTTKICKCSVDTTSRKARCAHAADFFLKSGDYFSEFGKVIFQKKKPLSFSDRGFNKT